MVSGKISSIAIYICKGQQFFQDMITDKVIDETDDRIVITQSKFTRIIAFPTGLFAILLGVAGALYFLSNPSETIVAIIIDIIFSVTFIFGGIFFLYTSLFQPTIIVDRTLEKVILKKDSFAKPLRSLKEIPFSDIKKFHIEHYYAEGGESWSVCLITNDNKSELIFQRDSESYIRDLANRISILTRKDIAQKVN